jgi:hypothetical protein
MVLLVAVTLCSAIVATIAGLWQGTQQGSQSAAAAAGPSSDKPPIYLAADRTPVRVVGAPFVPNLNPRDR